MRWPWRKDDRPRTSTGSDGPTGRAPAPAPPDGRETRRARRRARYGRDSEAATTQASVTGAYHVG